MLMVFRENSELLELFKCLEWRISMIFSIFAAAKDEDSQNRKTLLFGQITYGKILNLHAVYPIIIIIAIR
jgi:hypothetical protein